MAEELSQEEVLDFLCQGGGKVPNASLLAHFKHFLRDPQAGAEQLLKRRERFKRYVNSVAVVKQEGAVKYVVLRSRYRDLLGEDLTPAIPAHTEQTDEPAISNNRHHRETGSDVLHAAQVGGRWGCHTGGDNGYACEPALSDRCHQQPVNGSDGIGTSHGKGWHRPSYDEAYSHDPESRLQQPSSQPPSSSSYSSAPGDHKSTSPLSKSSSSETNTYLPSGHTFQQDKDQPLVSSRTFPQLPSDLSLSTRKTSYSPSDNNIPSSRTSSSLIDTYLPSSKTSSSLIDTYLPSSNTTSTLTDTYLPLSKTSSSPIDTYLPSSKTTSSLIDTYLTSSRTSSSLIDTYLPSSRTSSSLIDTYLPSSKSTSSLIDTYLPSSKTSPSHTTLPSTQTSSPPTNTSIPFHKTSSPTNTSIPFHKTSSSPVNTSIPFHKTSSSPVNTSIPFHKTSSSPVNTSIPLIRSSSSPSSASIPINKTNSSSSNGSTKTSEPPSNTSSPFSRDCYNAESHSASYSKDSSFCSSVETPSLLHSPSPGSTEHQRPPLDGDHKTTANSTFVSTSCGGQQEQKRHCTEIQTPAFDSNGMSPREVHLELEDNSIYIKEQQGHGFYEELADFPPPSRYTNCTHPFSSLLLPHDSSTAPLDMQLEDYQSASPCPSPPLPLNDMHDLWMYQMPVFKSIRCQLSLQDLEDFVDQESCGSEESDSGEGADCDTEHKDDEDYSSDSNNEKYVQYIEEKCESPRRCPPNRKFLSIIEQYSKLQSGDLLGAKDTLVECEPKSSVPAETSKSPYIAKSFLTDQAPILFELAKQPTKHRASSRFQELMSSSDDELIDRDYRKRRRPSRAKRPPNIVLVQPDVDLLLATKPVSSNTFIVNFADHKEYQAQYVPKANVDFLLKKSFNYKSSTVPLDPAEHDWIVKSASGSWLQVYGLFSQEPQLALRKDFISGYTALHWFAKHGAIEMFYKFVTGAKKAGIELDFNIKSNGGYTPLHIAAIHGHHKVAAMLVEKLKVNVKLRDNSGKRAWQYLSCNTSGEVWQLLGAPKGKTIFAARTLNTTYLNTQNKSSQINRKTSLAAFLKPQHQKWKANNHPVLREREIYSD